jgi:nucleotide-binding universal stress UspA family protein
MKPSSWRWMDRRVTYFTLRAAAGPNQCHSVDLPCASAATPASAWQCEPSMGLERAAMLEIQESDEIQVILKDEERQGNELLRQASERFIELIKYNPHRPVVNEVLLRGDAFEEINLYIEDHPTELIMVGSRGLSGVKSWLLGSLSRKLVHSASCSVLVVRGTPTLKEAGMSRIENTLFCDGCGIEIVCKPYMSNNRTYCCEDCAAGKPCVCENRLEMEAERRDPYPEAPS